MSLRKFPWALSSLVIQPSRTLIRMRKTQRHVKGREREIDNMGGKKISVIIKELNKTQIYRQMGRGREREDT